MGRRGPQPQPTALKLERGNPGQRRLNEDEPELEAPPLADAPARLKGRALVEWDRLVKELITKGVLTVGDMHAFEQYCVLVGEVEDYEKLIKRVGREEAHAKGYANYILRLRAQVLQQASHLGLTPSSRSGVKVVKPQTVQEAHAKRERFFGTGAGKPRTTHNGG
jgi:P27 family predicted phage terminase small subunit